MPRDTKAKARDQVSKQMTDDERDEILRQAFETIARIDSEASDLEQRQQKNLEEVEPVDERARLEKLRASMPPKR